jgi:hypothetical protein
MIQLLGNCFGQEASTLYAGGACAPATAQTLSASKQTRIAIENAFVHPLKLFMASLQIATRGFSLLISRPTGIYTGLPPRRMLQSSFSTAWAAGHAGIQLLISSAAAMYFSGGTSKQERN